MISVCHKCNFFMQLGSDKAFHCPNGCDEEEGGNKEEKTNPIIEKDKG